MGCFGQVVIGPPGSGKSTYCSAMQGILQATGRRVSVINLDPANNCLPYKCDIDISELITLENVMEKMKLGPNGGLMYCMEFLERNVEWLKMKMSNSQDDYFLLDCPGQVELFTHHHSVKNITHKLQEWDFKLATVHLVDCHLCSDPGKFISALLTSLSTMLQIELPHINVLSKVDLIQQFGKLAFGLDFYTDVLDLNYLLEHLSDDPFFRNYKTLNQSLVGLIEDYSLVSFIPLTVQSKDSMLNVVKSVDMASGYAFQGGSMISTATGADFDYFRNASLKEEYINPDEDHQ